MFERQRILLMAAVILAAPGCASFYAGTSARAPAYGPSGVVGVSYFYDALSPYGRWIESRPFGWCWAPYDATADWRPYDNGRWVYTDLGWAWDADEPWGWACYHYGRWLSSPEYGWVWVPGAEWAPAWVAWRYDDDWVGWAPLPPEARWQGAIGNTRGTEGIPSQPWCFIPLRQLADGNVRPHLAPVARNVTLIEQTHAATRFELRDGRPANVGVDPQLIERATGKELPRLKPVDGQRPGRGQQSIGAGAIGFFRPAMRGAAAGSAPRPEWRAQRAVRIDPAAQRQWDAERRGLDSSLSLERAALERDHDRETHAPPPNVAPGELRRRHDAERRAFEAHAARARQVLESRWRNRLVKPAPQKATWRPTGTKGGMGQSESKDDDVRAGERGKG